MSEFTQNKDEQAILAALELIESGMPDSADSADSADSTDESTVRPTQQDAQQDGDSGDMTLERLYIETLGLLPYELEPIEPSADHKARLMATIASEAVAASSEPDQANEPPVAGVVPFSATRDSERRIDSASAAAPQTQTPAPAHVRQDHGPNEPYDGRFRAAATSSSRTPTWFAVAASIVALVMSAAAGWLFTQLRSTEETVRQLDQQVNALSERERSMNFFQTELSSKIETMSQALAVMSTPGVEVCPLRPMNNRQASAYAMLYMAPDNNNWYLRATNLQPMSEGQVYRVWLDTPEGPISVGTLQPGEDDAELRFTRESLGDREMLSVTVTLEDDMKSSEPEGPIVLFGDEKMQIL